MSGALRYRVNRRWIPSIFANVSPARFFWEWLHFINDHTGLTVIEVGTGTTSHGTSIPASWLSWDATVSPTTLTPAMDSNSWIVFEAVNADPLLNGGGTTPWQAKIQMSLSSGYADPSGTNYGMNGNVGQVALRASATGGWVGSSTWDFSPGYGTASGDMKMFGSLTTSYLDYDYYLDIVGDDDTLWWRGCSMTYVTNGTPRQRPRGGCMGMINRYNSSIAYPFFVYVTPINTNNRASNTDRWAFTRIESLLYKYSIFDIYDANVGGYTYSLGYDGSRVSSHRSENWKKFMVRKIWKSHFSNKLIMLSTLIRQYASPDYYDIYGTLRGYLSVPPVIGTSTLLGSNLEYIQICCEDDLNDGGVLMPWEPGVIPIW